MESTLTLPAEMPLFNYNINFEGLRKILEGVEVKTNRHEDQLQKLQEEVEGKLATPKVCSVLVSSITLTSNWRNPSYLE